MYWIPYAFVRIVVFFSAGILLGIYFPEILSEQYAVTLFFCFLTSYAFLFLLNWKKQRSVINPGFLGLAVVFVSGYLNVLFYTHSRQDDHISRIDQSVEYYRATVADFPIEKPAYFKQVGLVSAVRIGGEWHPYQGKVLLYFSKNTFQTPYGYGEEVLIKGTFNKVQPPSNPGEFDYRHYLAFANIYHQHYLNKDDVLYVGNDPPSLVIATAIRVRSWASVIIAIDPGRVNRGVADSSGRSFSDFEGDRQAIREHLPSSNSLKAAAIGQHMKLHPAI